MNRKAKSTARTMLDRTKAAAEDLVGRGIDGVTQRQFADEMVARFAQVTEVLVAQHAEIEALRRRIEALERG